MTSVWPDLSAATSPGQKVRDQLDYLVWIAEAMQPVGFHRADEIESWRGRVHRAYVAIVDSMVPGHGDPLPPDVPPTVHPGAWPDVAAATMPGMTIRHQLAVIRTIAAHTREDRHFPHSPAGILAWTGHVQTAYDALDHGPSLPMPPSARTEPPQPLAHTGEKTTSSRRKKSQKSGPRAARTTEPSKKSAAKRGARKR